MIAALVILVCVAAYLLTRCRHRVEIYHGLVHLQTGVHRRVRCLACARMRTEREPVRSAK